MSHRCARADLYSGLTWRPVIALLTLFDENIVWTSPGPPELPTAGTRRERAEVAEFFKAVNDLWDVQRFDAETLIADGDRVVVLGRETSTVRATGQVVEQPWAHAFTLKDGKVMAFQEYIDTAAVVAELQASSVKV